MSSNPTVMFLFFGPDASITTDVGLTLTTDSDTVLLGPGTAVFANDSGAAAGSYSNTGQIFGNPNVQVTGTFQTFAVAVVVQISGTTANGTITLDSALTVDICIGSGGNFVIAVPVGQTTGTFSVAPPSFGLPRELDHRKLLAEFRAGVKTLKRGAR